MTVRDYLREYRLFHSSKKSKAQRAARGRARTLMGLKKGDPREVDHTKSLSEGGSNKRPNLRVVSRRKNRKKGKK